MIRSNFLRVRACLTRTLIVAGVLAAVLVPAVQRQRSSEAAAPAAPSAATLPALPVGWPSTVQIGLASSPGDAAAMKGVAPYAFRYQYLAGGVNTGTGWANWNANGGFVTNYIQDSISSNITRCQGGKTDPRCAAFRPTGLPGGVNVFMAMWCQITKRSYVLTFLAAPGMPKSVVLRPEFSAFSSLTPRM